MRICVLSRCFSVWFLALFLIAPFAGGAVAMDLRQAIEARIESGEGGGLGDDDDERMLRVHDFYRERNFAPIWTTDSGAADKARTLIQLLHNAHLEALHPNSYRADILRDLISASDAETLSALELVLSKALIDYGRDLGSGTVVPNKVNKDVFIFPKGPTPEGLLARAANTDNIAGLVETLKPQTPNYARLRAGLARYREWAQQGGWGTVPDGEVLKPGMEQERVPALRARMVSGGDLPQDKVAESEAAGNTYDPVLVDAVKHFQYRHGIDQDGVVGPATLASLNTPIETRVRQMEVNMERRRWMEDDLGERYIFVNLADQFLKVVKNGKTVHTALTVVGKTYHSTPVFSKKMKYIVINPYWNVPSSIARKEYLPKLRRDPGYLLRQNIHVLRGGSKVDPYAVNWSSVSSAAFPFRLRQDPGKKNALGRIKFMFPNRFNVYIHDTPAKSLFAKSKRVFSHGCIRVQDPPKLAEVLLQDQGWSLPRVKNQITSGKKRIVNLKKPIPVHITYLTAWVNKDGSVHFREDVYGRDKRLSAALGLSL
ncbi:MAG: L,D-transpeptidase family protein [Pseudomonadota bacterium]